VLLSSKNIRLLNPGVPKLLPKWLGPFTIIDYCGSRKNPTEDGASEVVAYKLELPETMRVRNVFHVSLLKPYSRNQVVQPPPLPIVVEGEEWFMVEKILNHRDTEITIKRATKHAPTKTKLQHEYFGKWLNYGDEHNSWEPYGAVSELDMLKEYHAYRNFPLS
jgi:hypothetical protein